MQLAKLLVYFTTSPALHLLRARTAPFIVDFLDRQFKRPGRIAIPHTELAVALNSYLEDLRETQPDALSGRADDYLREWCSPQFRYLQRTLEPGRDEPVYQLTSHVEEVFLFLDRVLNQDLGFVGTESRLKLAIETLNDLVIGASDDPKKRLAHLREEQARLQAEIEQIETTGRIAKYQPAQIRERFATAVSLLRQLQGDFRAVEESFYEIASQVQQRQLEGTHSRGRILEFALDAEDLLKTDDQGVSFYEFVRLILSPNQTERVEKIVREVRRLPELKKQAEGLETVRNIVTLLQREAEQVMGTNQRLSATLRRMLDSRAYVERQRIGKVLQEIQSFAVAYSASPGSDEIGLSLDLDLAIESPFRRTFWSESARFETVDLTGFDPDANERLLAFQQLAAMRRLDWQEMRQRVRQMLSVEHAPTLGRLLEHHPAEAGVVEVIGYIQIASEDGHQIDPDMTETVFVSSEEPEQPALLVTIPRVTFLPEE